jgi:hypothetical protein
MLCRACRLSSKFAITAKWREIARLDAQATTAQQTSIAVQVAASGALPTGRATQCLNRAQDAGYRSVAAARAREADDAAKSGL